MIAQEKIIRLPEVLNRVGLGRSSIYAGIKMGTFPKQVKLGERSAGWMESEINDWIIKQASNR